MNSLRPGSVTLTSMHAEQALKSHFLYSLIWIFDPLFCWWCPNLLTPPTSSLGLYCCIMLRLYFLRVKCEWQPLCTGIMRLSNNACMVFSTVSARRWKFWFQYLLFSKCPPQWNGITMQFSWSLNEIFKMRKKISNYKVVNKCWLTSSVENSSFMYLQYNIKQKN